MVFFRNGDTLEQAVNELEALYKKSFNVAVKNQPGANPELVYAYRTQKMLRVALTIALGAFQRTESAVLTSVLTTLSVMTLNGAAVLLPLGRTKRHNAYS